MIAAAACLALALASLALPSGVGYDVYSWLLWGRDLSHFGLSITGSGTSWKPLPALIDALLAPLGRNAAAGWLVIARAATLFAVVMAFRVAWRLSPRATRPLAGIVAAATLALTHEWFRREGVGNSEGLLVAFGLLAVDRHLDRKHGQAFALMVAGGLIRPEMWAFIAGYGLWLAWRTRGSARAAVAVGALAAPLLWFGGDWIGSGHLTTASDRALGSVGGSSPATAQPALTVAEQAVGMVPLPAWIAIVAGLLIALMRRRVTPVVALTACAVAWTAVVALMAQRGYPPLRRFVFMASALEAVAAGIGAAIIVAGLAGRRRIASAVLGVLAAAVFAYGAVPDARLVPGAAAGIDQIADRDSELAKLVSEAGGPAAVLRCGTPRTSWYTVTALAWDLGVRADRVADEPTAARSVRFLPKGNDWRVSEARRCGLVAAQTTKIRHRPAHQQRTHDKRNT